LKLTTDYSLVMMDDGMMDADVKSDFAKNPREMNTQIGGL